MGRGWRRRSSRVLGERLFNNIVPVATLVFVALRGGRHLGAQHHALRPLCLRRRRQRARGAAVRRAGVAGQDRGLCDHRLCLGARRHRACRAVQFRQRQRRHRLRADRDRRRGDRRHQPVRRRRARWSAPSPARSCSARSPTSCSSTTSPPPCNCSRPARSSCSPRCCRSLVRRREGEASVERWRQADTPTTTKETADATRGSRPCRAQLCRGRRWHCRAARGSRAPALRRPASPIAKACGPNDKYVIGFSQANNAEPYRQHVNDELTGRGEADPAVQAADRRRRRQRQHADLAGRQFHHPEGRPAADLAVRGGAADAGGERAHEGRHSGDRTRPQDGGVRARTTRRSSAATITRSPSRPAKYTAKTLLPDGGEVAVLEGLPSSTPAVERLNGFKDGVKGNPKI